MKKILLLSLFSTIIFSCSEYDDDGTPTSGNIVITNPDGTKKIKSIESNATGNMDLDLGMETAGTTIESVTSKLYSTDSYSNTTTGTVQMSYEDGEDSSVTPSVEEEIDGYTINQISTAGLSGANSNSTSTFSYSSDNLSSYAFSINGENQTTGTFTVGENSISLASTAVVDSISAMNWEFNLTDGFITTISSTDIDSQTNYNFDITRANGNITGLTISSGTDSETYSYLYDQNINPLHLVYQTPLQQTNAEIVRLVSGGFFDQLGGTQLDIYNFESSFRTILVEASNNLTSVSENGTVVDQRTYTYDEEGYPITATSSYSDSIDLGGIFDALIEMMTAMLEAFGATEEEIEEMVADMQSELSGGVQVDFDATATFTYYE